MIFTWLNNEELREIGWEEEHIRSGLVGQVAAFFFVKDKDDVYNVRRNFMRGTYDCEENGRLSSRHGFEIKSEGLGIRSLTEIKSEGLGIRSLTECKKWRDFH